MATEDTREIVSAQPWNLHFRLIQLNGGERIGQRGERQNVACLWADTGAFPSRPASLWNYSDVPGWSKQYLNCCWAPYLSSGPLQGPALSLRVDWKKPSHCKWNNKESCCVVLSSGRGTNHLKIFTTGLGFPCMPEVKTYIHGTLASQAKNYVGKRSCVSSAVARGTGRVKRKTALKGYALSPSHAGFPQMKLCFQWINNLKWQRVGGNNPPEPNAT